MAITTLEILQERAKSVLEITQEDLLKSSIRSLLHEKLRTINIERIASCRKYNVASIEELDNLIQQGTVNKFLVDEDFQHLDYLTWNARELKALLREIA